MECISVALIFSGVVLFFLSAIAWIVAWVGDDWFRQIVKQVGGFSIAINSVLILLGIVLMLIKILSKCGC